MPSTRRTMVGAGLAAVLLASCGTDRLVEPAPGERVFELVSVDDASLPFKVVWTGGRLGGGGTLTMTLSAAELLLRPDSSAVLLQRVRFQDDDMDSVAVETVNGFWATADGAMVWCPNTAGTWGPCTGAVSGDGAFIVEQLATRWGSHEFRLHERP